MFAKLKKKIQESEGGGKPMIDLDRSLGSPAPGLASPIRTEPEEPSSNGEKSAANGKSPLPVESHRRNSSAMATSSMDVIKDASREEVLVMLVKRTEQVKKLETKVSDLAAIIKDKNKSIEKLETALEKQQDVLTQKIQELNEQYQSNRSKMSEGFTLALQKKEESRNELAGKLNEVENYRQRYYQNLEEQEKMQELTDQEMAKLKNMLLSSQTEVSKCKKELHDKSLLLESADKKAKKLGGEVHSLMQQVSGITKHNEELSEQCRQQDELVQFVTREKQSLDDEVERLTQQLAQKQSSYQSLEQKHVDLKENHQILQRNSDQHRQKSTTMLSEKEENLSHLQDRLNLLEQRQQDSQLTGDERLTAVQAEREQLEKKLNEAREQLLQVKTSWSDKISHLERQIANLNEKISEDAKEFAHAQTEAENLIKELQRQGTDLQSQLHVSEKSVEQLQSSLKDGDKKMDKQKKDMEIQLQRYSEDAKNREEDLETAHAKLENMVKCRDSDKLMFQQRITQLQSGEDDWLSKEIDMEKQITELEDQVTKLKGKLEEKEYDWQQASNQLDQCNNQLTLLQAKVTDLESTGESSQAKLTEYQTTLEKLSQEFQFCVKEKDELLLRNAQLSQEVEASKRQLQHQHEEASGEWAQREKKYIQSIEQEKTKAADLQNTLSDLHGQVEQHKDKVQEIKAETDEISRLTQLLTQLEDQISEKNRMIKSQQQRIGDLRKTLQKELKVQSLPNDEPVHGNSSIMHPMDSVGDSPAARAALSGGTALVHDHHASQPAALPVSSSQIHNLSRTTTSTVKSGLHPRQCDNSVGLAPLDRLVVPKGKGGFPQYSTSSLSFTINENADGDDINLPYVKHVVLKFILSRESEAIHLIKALSMLLHFNRDEQKLIHDMLEWKMSWFGSRPELGKGQMAKIIPHSY